MLQVHRCGARSLQAAFTVKGNYDKEKGCVYVWRLRVSRATEGILGVEVQSAHVSDSLIKFGPQNVTKEKIQEEKCQGHGPASAFDTSADHDTKSTCAEISCTSG